MTLMKVRINNIRQPAEPKPEVVECAIVELLEIAQRQGTNPTDFIQLLDSGMHISDFLAALTPHANANNSIDCDCGYRKLRPIGKHRGSDHS